VLVHPASDLGGIVEVEPLLKRTEAGLAVLVEADDLAIDDGRTGESGPQALDDLGEAGFLRLVVSTEKGQVLPIEAGWYSAPGPARTYR
jgi:hypothetical protein